MPFYLRKSFRMGPVRLNLSKSGLGLSGGVKGARLGVNSRGRAYVHGGRHGMYYRKQLSGKGVSARQEERGGCGDVLLAGVFLVVVLMALALLLEHPWILGAGALAGAGYGGHRLWKRHRLSACKQELDRALVNTDTAPAAAETARLTAACRRVGLTETLRRDLYQAVLDRVLDDKQITDAEQARLNAARTILRLEPAQLQPLHRELFLTAWLEAIADQRITRADTAWIETLLDGLDIPRESVRRELETVNELIDAQQLAPPLAAVEAGEDAAHLQNSETLYLRQPAEVLSRRGSGDNLRWRVHREGTLLLTDKRLLVVGGGTTQLRLDDMTDVEIDFDEGQLVLHKHGVGRPTWIRTAKPFLTGRTLEIVMEE